MYIFLSISFCLAARLIIRTENFDGVTIQGEETGYYLCMNKKGAMVGRVSFSF